ncbi:Uncharacterised protein [Mycobacteroides abscessus subsp. massiliense]|nr:Uncharacterised protein [Mycobacteroides abscessus subsp. abscessus]SKQ82541.1 Uncharacterised protein [Mycobacteroides abscessus subsp. massiliense]SLC50428.1 Uncharacterised protein [Mycobacteroides abscessus subsp. massiliense]
MDRSGLISHPKGFGSLPAPKANWLCNFAASCFAYQTAPQAADCRRSRPRQRKSLSSLSIRPYDCQPLFNLEPLYFRRLYTSWSC